MILWDLLKRDIQERFEFELVSLDIAKKDEVFRKQYLRNLFEGAKFSGLSDKQIRKKFSVLYNIEFE
jgi:hypothetical protein